MTMHVLRRGLRSVASVGVAILLAAAAVHADAITVMSSGALSAALRELVPAFERASGSTLTIVSGGSVGGTPDSIPDRLQRGERADVVIMAAAGIDELANAGRVVAGRQDRGRRQFQPPVVLGPSHPRVAHHVDLPDANQIAGVGVGAVEALNGAAAVVHGHRLDDQLGGRPHRFDGLQDVLLEIPDDLVTPDQPSAKYRILGEVPGHALGDIQTGAGEKLLCIFDGEGGNAVTEADWTPDAIAAHFSEIGDMSTAKALEGAFQQTQKYVEQAAKRAGVKL